MPWVQFCITFADKSDENVLRKKLTNDLSVKMCRIISVNKLDPSTSLRMTARRLIMERRLRLLVRYCRNQL